MGNERVIFSNRFDRPTLEQIEEEMKNKNYPRLFTAQP